MNLTSWFRIWLSNIERSRKVPWFGGEGKPLKRVVYVRVNVSEAGKVDSQARWLLPIQRRSRMWQVSFLKCSPTLP